MKFFNRDKLKVRSQIVDDGTKLYIDYNRLSKSQEIVDFKLKLFKEIVGRKLCLGIIDTNLMYRNKDLNKDKIMNELEQLFIKLSINYKKITSKDTDSIGVFGVPIKIDTKNRHNGYIMAFICTLENYEKIISIINEYNINCYVQKDDIDKQDLLNKIDLNYDEEDFIYQIYNDNFTKSIVIYSKNQDPNFAFQIVDTINKSL